MTWRIVVISSRAKLDLRLNTLVVRGEQSAKIHLGEIALLMIENTAVSLTAALIAELSKRKIKVIFVMKNVIHVVKQFLIMAAMIPAQKSKIK